MQYEGLPVVTAGVEVREVVPGVVVAGPAEVQVVIERGGIVSVPVGDDLVAGPSVAIDGKQARRARVEARVEHPDHPLPYCPHRLRRQLVYRENAPSRAGAIWVGSVAGAIRGVLHIDRYACVITERADGLALRGGYAVRRHERHVGPIVRPAVSVAAEQVGCLRNSVDPDRKSGCAYAGSGVSEKVTSTAPWLSRRSHPRHCSACHSCNRGCLQRPPGPTGSE